MSKYVNAVIKLYPGAVSKLNQAVINSLDATSEMLVADVVDKQVMPFDVGTLQKSIHVNDSNIEKGYALITVQTPYARRLYYHPEYTFQTKNNQYAGAHWYNPWLPGGKYQSYCRSCYVDFLKKFGGI